MKKNDDGDLLNQLSTCFGDFLVPLRMKDGFKKKEYEALCLVLSRCAELWSNSGSIPKMAVAEFVDAYSAMVSASYLYPDPLGEEIRQEAEKMQDLIRRCCE